MTDFQLMQTIAKDICEVVEQKDKDYGSSWRKRGGPGAFMVMARKWDRIENLVKQDNYDIFACMQADRGGIKDDIRDLVGYLLLHLEADEAPTADLFASMSLPGVRLPIVESHPPIHPASVAYAERLAEDAMFQQEGMYGDGRVLYRCRVCRASAPYASLSDAHIGHVCAGPWRGSSHPAPAPAVGP